MTKPEQKLLRRLRRLRGNARVVLVLLGLFRMGTVLLATALVMLAVDWLLWLPGQVRLLLSAGFVGLAGWVVVRWIARPATVSISLGDMAARVDRHFAQLNDRLASTVNFLEWFEAGTGDGSRGMMRRVVDETGRLIAPLPLARVIRLSPMLRVLGGALAFAGVWTTIALASPDWPAVGLQRFVNPFGPVHWPKRIQIEPVTGDMIVALGEPLSLVMHVTRGDSLGLRPMVHLRGATGRRRTYVMESEGGDTYRWTAGGVTEGFTYSFEAGDDATDVYKVRVVRRPAVQSARAHIAPPAYATDRPPVEVDLAARDFAAAIASRITLYVTASKPIAHDDQGRPQARLDFESGSSIRLGPVEGSDTELTCEFLVQDNATFRIRLTGVDGFGNIGEAVYRLTALADDVPAITVIEPVGQLEVTPNATVAAQIEIEDDFGITTAALAGRVRDRQDDFSIDLTDALRRSEKAGGVQASLAYEWELTPLSLSPGDIVVYHFEAADNYRLDGQTHEPGRSTDLRLKVLSVRQFADRLRDEFQLLRGKVRQLLTEQETIREETASVGGGPEDKTPLSEGQRDAVARLTGQQNRLAVRTIQLGRMFQNLRAKMERNRIEDQDARREAEQNADELKQISQGAMVEAGRALSQAADPADPQQDRPELAEAQKQQTAAADALQKILQQMDRWGNFNDLVRKTRDLLDRQETLGRETSKTGKATLGKRVDELTPEQRKEIDNAARRQQRLAEETETLTRRMGEQAESSRKRDPAGSEALREARRAAEKWDLVGKMQRAAKQLGQNRAAQAGTQQRQAERGLREMLTRLEQRQRRQLAELAKRLEKAEDVVRLLIEQQEKLLADNRTAQEVGKDSAFFQGLSERQTVLKRNTQQLAQEMGGSDAMIRPSRHTRKAATEMSRAAIKLADADGKNAEPSQGEAIKELRLALAQLIELRRKAQQEMLNRRLADIRGDLRKVRQAQEEVRESSRPIIDRFAAKKRLRRIDAQRLNRLGTKEKDISRSLDEIRRRIDSSAVYNWVIQRITDDVEAVRTRFDQRDLSPKTVQLQDGIVSRLDRLIDALKIERGDKDEGRFAGGGSGSRPGRPGIPPVAELKILKGMQLELNEHTVEINDGFDPDNASENQLTEVKTLGDDQEQIRGLAEQVVRKAMEHPR